MVPCGPGVSVDKSDSDKKAGSRKVGGVSHDSRGNAIWEWASETGRNAIDSTSRLLKRLEVPGLKIQDEEPPAARPPDERASQPPPGVPPGITPAARGRGGARGKDAGGGYDPYAGRAARAGQKPAPKPAAPLTKPSSAPAPRPSLWQRLLGKR